MELVMDMPKIISTLQRRLGFRDDLQTEIVDIVNEVREELDKDEVLGHPWFLMTEIASASTTALEPRVQLPTDYLNISEDVRLYWYNGDAEEDKDKWQIITKAPYRFSKYWEPGQGTPKYYDLIGDDIHIFPLPDDVYTIKMVYYGRTAAYVADTVERDWIKYEPQLVISGALERLATDLRDVELVGKAQSEYQMNFRAAQIRIVARRAEGMTYTMGGDD
jgi:hypothetical protein